MWIFPESRMAMKGCRICLSDDPGRSRDEDSSERESRAYRQDAVENDFQFSVHAPAAYNT
jgi:hypothetical protein